MKWRKHSSAERNQIQSKLVRKHFGAEGYGIYQALKEVIAENVEAGNEKEWGSVSRLHDVETLADECMTTPENLRNFLKFCNEKKIFEKRDGKLFCDQMLNELDDYAERIKKGFYKGKVGTKSGKVEQNTDEVETKSDNVTPNKKKIRKEEDKKRLEEIRLEPEKILATPDVAEISLVEEKKDPVNLIIDRFTPVNPHVSRLFANTTQRSSVQRMLKAHGLEKLSALVSILAQTNMLVFYPTITTPLQLEDKLGTLLALLAKDKARQKPLIAVMPKQL